MKESEWNSRGLKKIDEHPSYSYSDPFLHDLALLTLDKKVDWNGAAVHICLPGDVKEYAGKNASVAGWGHDKERNDKEKQLNMMDTMHYVQIPVLENKKCQEWFYEAGERSIDIRDEQMLSLIHI